MNLQIWSFRSVLFAWVFWYGLGAAFAEPEPAKRPVENQRTAGPARKSLPPAANKNKSSPVNKGPAKNNELGPEREQAAIDFARRHHPELVGLIAPLKESNPKEYQRAVKELFRASERLSTIQAKFPIRYELELEAWKLQSQTRLLAARLTMAEDPDLEQQLRDALNKKSAVQLKLLQNELDTLEARLKLIQSEIEKNEQSRDQQVQQEYDRLMKKSNRDRTAASSTGTTGKPAGKKSTAAKAVESRTKPDKTTP